MARYVRIDNVTRGSTVADRCRVAGSILQRIFGLHLVAQLKAGEGLLLPGATTIDTTFMSYAIDLVFLDRSLRVTRTVPNLRPWRMVLRTDGGRDCLELPAGAAAASGTQAGDQLAFTEADISAR
jgi:uncharacterized membrane protein (UPF0127 family)